MLIATDASWTNDQDPRDARDQLLDDGVQIYVIGMYAHLTTWPTLGCLTP